MNAFLIFCKRHRSVVRDKYPNLENRSITKILGEWWANLDKEEKACYTGLAKQYKDAFFSANPDFKWYKLPAPPLRTLASRPREHSEKNISPTYDLFQETELEKTNNNSTKIDFNKKPRDHDYEAPKTLSMFTPGKLADEAQMGGLSRLLDAKTETSTRNPYYSPTPLKVGMISNEYRSLNVEKKAGNIQEETIRELQNALSETTKVFTEDFDENQARIYHHGVPSDIFTRQHVIDQVVDKQYSKEDEYGYQRNWSDDEKNMKSGRSCKGKRYQEFMAVGGLMANKRQRRERDKTPEDNYNPSCSWDSGSMRSEDSAVAENKIEPNTEPAAQTEPATDSIEASELDNNVNKTFKAADFDLDAKIAALPSLSLEKFQQKKRENKRRKKTFNSKPKVLGSSHIVNSVPNYESRREMVESWREQVIGSQKRKPRKVSITRFEINSLVSNMVPNEFRKVSPEIKIATEAPCTVVQSMEICKQPPHSVDLLALATLAEVASNTSKMDESGDNFTAKASDDYASTV
ncbi:HMG (high mobility group) box domain-containing protein [Phthorimaea operculella]|nr:HMG (high mobility group) box domain-containing protein [Phthorimaea operculella]